MSKYAFEGLATYEKSAPGGGASALLGPLMMLKACCTSNQGYIDRLLLPLMRVLHRMVKDHVAASTPDSATSDLLVSFDKEILRFTSTNKLSYPLMSFGFILLVCVNSMSPNPCGVRADSV